MAEITLLFAFIGGLISFLSPCILPLVPAFLTFVAGNSLKEVEANVPGVRLRIFLSSVFFVLGFSLIFSLLGVLLQSVLSTIAYDLQIYLGYIGGLVIIFFGLLLLGIIKIPALSATHKINVKRTRYQYLTSFLFGAAFAVGWTPCVTVALGAVLTLAITEPGAAFPLMLAYSLGLGLPFLLAGLFISQASGFIRALSPYLTFLNTLFGIILILLGMLVFTGTLNLVANFEPAVDFFESLNRVLGLIP